MSERIVGITEHLDPESRAWLMERATAIDVNLDEPGADAALARCDALVVRTYTRVDDALLRQTPRLRVVGRAGVGLDNIDVPACRARGVEVVHTPEANTQAVVEFTIRMLMGTCLDMEPIAPLIAPSNCGLDDAAWHGLRATSPERKQLSDMTVGIIGFGRIGRGVARVLGALSAEVLYHDLLEVPQAARFGARPVALDRLLASSHVVSIHVDGRAENRHLVNEAFLRLTRDEAILLNTSRGFVVDNSALAAFLHARPGARACLDVHDPEPIPRGAPLVGLPNVLITPHIAAHTTTAHRRMGQVVEDVLAVLEGRSPRWAAATTG